MLLESTKKATTKLFYISLSSRTTRFNPRKVSLDSDFFMSFCRCPPGVLRLSFKLCENLNAEDAYRTKKNSLIKKNFERNFKISRKITQDIQHASSRIQLVQRTPFQSMNIRFVIKRRILLLFKKRSEEYAKLMRLIQYLTTIRRHMSS